MKIAIMKATMVVAHAGDNLWFTEYGLRGPDFLNATLSEETCDLVLLDSEISLPEDFASNAYTFNNNVFALTEYGQTLATEREQRRVELLKQSIVASTQARLDDFAKTRNYDSILSATTYATSTIAKFQQEGQYAVSVRDQTWQKLYQILQEVETGARPIPSSFQDIEPLLPPLAWPN
jgi:hypothetical protein